MKSIRNWSIRTRLLAAFVGVLIPYLALAGVGAVGFAVFWRSVREIQQEVVQEVRGAADLQIALVNLLMPANDYLITADVTERDEFERRLARAWEALGRVERMHLHQPEELRALAEVRSRLPEIEALSREILALADPRGRREAPGKMKALDALGEEAAAGLGRFRKANEREIAEEIERGAALMWRVTAAALAALIVSVAGGVGLALLFTRWIGAPLKAIAEGSRRMAEGDLSARVEESAGAELGATARAFNLMAAEVGEAKSRLERRVAELAALFETGRLLTGTLELSEVLRRLAGLARTRLGMDVVRILVRDPASGLLVHQTHEGVMRHDVEFQTRFQVGEGLSGWGVEHRAVVVAADVLKDPRTRTRVWMEAEGIVSYLGVPLLVGDSAVGFLACMSRARRDFAPEEIALAEALASQAALAIENARLFEEGEERRLVAEALAAVGRDLTRSLNFATVAQQISDSIRGLLGAFQSAFYRLEPESGNLVVVAVSGDLGPSFVPTLTFPRGNGAVGLAVRDLVPVASENVMADPRITFSPELRSAVEQAEFRSVLAVPLIAKGQVVGAISVRDKSGRVFTEDEIRVAQAFADQAALALENARLVEEMKAHQARLEALLDVSRGLSAIQTLDALLGQITEACGRLLDSSSVGIRLVDGEELVVGATWGDAKDIMLTRRLRKGDSISGIVVATGEPVVVSDAANDPRLIPTHREALRRHGYRAWLGVPVKAGEHVLGVLSIQTRREGGFSSEDLAIATAFASQAAIALENARLFAEVADRIRAVEEALASVKRLQGLLPICAWCKKVRRDQNYWQSVEGYVAEHTDARFSHGICPECREKLAARRDANG